MRAPRKYVIPEKNVQETVRDFMELDGWRAIRTDPVSDRARGKGFGEVGMPDYLFIRYWAGYEPTTNARIPENEADLRTEAQVLWIEFKRKSKLPTVTQMQWHITEINRGALVKVVDDIDDYILWYKDSGLCRRML
jgi:hypothetical protein